MRDLEEAIAKNKVRISERMSESADLSLLK